MPDDNNKSKDENLANNSPPAEQAPKTDGDAAQGASGKEGGGFLEGIIDTVKETVENKVKDLRGTDSGKIRTPIKMLAVKLIVKTATPGTKTRTMPSPRKRKKAELLRKARVFLRVSRTLSERAKRAAQANRPWLNR